ncbi:MAG: hypothetical protein E6789_09585, partial [Clostridium baratii]|nr:hypothetical protein [Clostridium baratii]
MKLTKRHIVLSIIVGIIVCINLAYYLISRVDKPIAIKKYSELFFNDRLTIEMIKENNTDLEVESEGLFYDGADNITVEFPEINKTYYMSANNHGDIKNKYKLLKYNLIMNQEEDLSEYINENGAITLTRAIIIDKDKNYDVDLGEITLHPNKDRYKESKMRQLNSYGNNEEQCIDFYAHEEYYLNKIESKYLDELKKYYDFYIIVGGENEDREKISIENIKYPYKIKKDKILLFVAAKKDNIDII